MSTHPVGTGLDIRVGVDCESVARWRAMLTDQEGAGATLFTAAEHDYCRAAGDPAESYAGSWCAKEAVVKALAGIHTVTMRDIEIRRTPDGAPTALVHDRPPQGVDYNVRVSITHTADVAFACAVVAVLPREWSTA